MSWYDTKLADDKAGVLENVEQSFIAITPKSTPLGLHR